MKKLILFFGLVLASICSYAQNSNPGAAIPPYSILTTDSNYATPANLKKHRKLMLIYFAPDCPHCQHLTEEMKPKMKEFGNTQIVMITWTSIKEIKDFVRDYDLKKYPNITVGTEGTTYAVLRYFNVQTTPYIAIYNSNGKLAKAFDKAPEIDKLITMVKNADK